MQISNYVLLAKQPIYKANLDCFAFELLFRSPMNLSAMDVGADIATNQVLLNYCASISTQAETYGLPVFLNVDAAFVIAHDIPPVDPHCVVFELTQCHRFSPELLSAIQRWKDKGAKLSLDAYDFAAELDPLIPLLDFVKVDVSRIDSEALPRLMSAAQVHKCRWIAERVEDEGSFEYVRTLGFELFQGYFLAQPQNVSGVGIRPGVAVTMRVIKALDRPSITMDEIASLVSQDPKLAMQMLKIINSSLFSLPRPVEDLKSALVFLGIDLLRQWALIIAFLSNGELHIELCRFVLLRAKTCETLMLRSLRRPDLAPIAFLAGLVSAVDVLLNISPDVFLQQVKLSKTIEQAVLKKAGLVGEVLAQTCELEYKLAHMHDQVSDIAPDLIDCYQYSEKWSEQVVSTLKGK